MCLLLQLVTLKLSGTEYNVLNKTKLQSKHGNLVRRQYLLVNWISVIVYTKLEHLHV